ncbi:ATP-dependent DNA helicase RecG [Flammeovirga kamogawensis]|uniref:ATP-dependent DNA helicase RecG n=1 Tax=Flammeovirga kamogawensis TaxID=373891 RepID=A0ABX8GSM6_9BACT|nr:ATP-dependent DNA helicase RecG [Flammeovirga kamogawensis]MBB6464072.1 ATP-dependent DNA helicase RecG [Flammeovirga kamogawensis]QWG06556.1 ATP-dependent DNA helicase RecG [Flammeovirga kamogawensis]TRX68383.1 ATP-dependent DNA helicase RecG [Flammeovirga kamogawensis]
MNNIFDTKIEFLKGVGAVRAEILNKELGVYTFGDLLEQYPFRHEDRTRFYKINEVVTDTAYVQMIGRLTFVNSIGEGRSKRLVATFSDETGEMEFVWFRGAKWVEKSLKVGMWYIAYGKPQRYGFKFSISHPELDEYDPSSVTPQSTSGGLVPVYHTSEKMKTKKVDSRVLAKLTRTLLEKVYHNISETLPEYLIKEHNLISKGLAVAWTHFPKNTETLNQAKKRLKFEELFYLQLKIIASKVGKRTDKYRGQIFTTIPTFNDFFNNHLPFDLTGAQKRVIREIYNDMRSGYQMNRLLQGDVGSGKTIVAFMCMLMTLDNDAQSALMAPTEILAQQHYNGLKEFADAMGVTIELLTGSSKTKTRRRIDETLRDGSLKIIVGTHALIEDKVDFYNLGLCVIDEQHRFGVAQRAALWKKSSKAKPHMLVMTATPIPRTLAMTVYGDLEVSVIDELPAGRKPIITWHKFEKGRLRVFGFLKEQIELGRQVYIVYPLIEESETLDYQNLMSGYESVTRAFPDYKVSVVHGRMKAADKDAEMQRFAEGKTEIMVATTVIEVGVNVPNSTVMIIENAEKFGLAQLHQLRGRVGRGGEQSYCILMTGDKLSKDGKVRIKTMVDTTDGFKIADADLKLRGPGDIEGTQQSGVLDLRHADIGADAALLQEVRGIAEKILDEDPDLQKEENQLIKHQQSLLVKKSSTNWSRIS